MFSIQKWIVSFAILTGCCWVGSARAQDSSSVPANDPKLSLTSMVALGPRGFSTINDVALEDSLGMAYDVASLIKDPTIKSALSLTEEQRGEIYSRHQELVNELFTLDVVTMSDEERQQWKARFQEQETQLQELLTDQQRQVMTTLRFQTAISKYGLEKVLLANLFGEELRLDVDQIARTVNDYRAAMKQLQGQRKDFLQEANRAVLDLLPSKRSERIGDWLDDEQMKTLLENPLFVKGNTRARKSLPQVSAVARYLGRESVQRELELDDSIVAKIERVLKGHKENRLSDQKLWDSLERQVEGEAFQALLSRITLDQCEMFGTVNAYGCGIVATDFEWEENEREEFHQTCQEIYQEYLKKMQQAKFAAVLEAFQSLPKRQQYHIEEILGGKNLPQLDSASPLLR